MADALFPKTRQRVLSLVFGQAERRFTLSELIALAGSGSGAVQREVERLVGSGLAACTSQGRVKTYQANVSSPIFEELKGIVEKTGGVPEQVRAALAKLGDRVRFAILYGSVAKAVDTALSDVDVLVVGDSLTLEEVFAALEGAEHRLGRRVSPTIYSVDEFRKRRGANHPFLTKVLAGKYIVLIGTEDAVSTR